MTLYELAVKITADSGEFNKEVDGIGGKLKTLGSSVKSGIGTLAKVGVAGIGAAATAIGALAKKSVDGYAEYQQMVGGVQKLYGNMGMSLDDYAKSVGKSTAEVKDKWTNLGKAQETVLKNADNAYKTSGMSANQYMNVATSFSASLIKSLNGDTQKAADLTDTAMRSISDNWNTFGGDLGMIQSAYQGFAKQNYMMLDNLKLGYGGTKTEMEKLIADANEYAKANGQAADLSIDSFADIVTAIDLIQQKQQIAGTTAREANSTIEGSMNSLKAAWDNLVAGFANPDADISTLMENVVTSAGTAAKNVVPAVMQAIDGIGQAITQMMPVVTENIPKAFEQVGIPLIQTGAQLVTSLITGVISSLPGLASAISQQMPVLTQTITSSLSGIMGSIGEALGEFDFSSILEGVLTGISSAMSGFTDFIVPILGQIGTALQENVPVLLEAAMMIITQLTSSLSENAGSLLGAGLDLILSLAQGIINSVPTLLSYIPQIITNIAGIISSTLPVILSAGVKLIVMLGKGIIQAIPALIANFPKIISAIVAVWSAINWASLGTKALNAIKSGLAAAPSIIGGLLKSAGSAAGKAFRSVNWASVGKGAINLLKGGVTGAGRLILTAMKNIGKSAFNAFKSINWISLGRNIISGIGRGISGAAGIIVNAAKNAAKRAFNAAKSFLGIKSPSRLFRDKIGKNIGLGMALGIEDTEKNVDRAITGLNTDIADADIMSGIPIDTGSIDVTGGLEGTPTQAGAMGNTYIFNITNNVSGAENPEDFVDRMVRSLQLRVRMA